MDLVKTIQEFTSKGDAGERATFEAAMAEKLRDTPYKMSDLLWDVYNCQRDIEHVYDTLNSHNALLQILVDAMPAYKVSQPKKKKSHAKKSR